MQSDKTIIEMHRNDVEQRMQFVKKKIEEAEKEPYSLLCAKNCYAKAEEFFNEGNYLDTHKMINTSICDLEESGIMYEFILNIVEYIKSKPEQIPGEHAEYDDILEQAQTGDHHEAFRRLQELNGR